MCTRVYVGGGVMERKSKNGNTFLRQDSVIACERQKGRYSKANRRSSLTLYLPRNFAVWLKTALKIVCFKKTFLIEILEKHLMLCKEM